MSKKPKSKKAGRPPKPAAERSRACNTTLRPDVYAYLQSIGGGSASKGLRVAAERDYHAHAAEEFSPKTP